MSTRNRWLDEGIAVLVVEGTDGVRVDRLARRLGLTKGSFHHHFRGMPDYRTALLQRCREQHDAAIAEARASLDESEPAAAIAALPARLGDLDMRLDAALRGWAVADPEARSMVEAMDAARLDFLEHAWTRVLGPGDEAKAAALLPHLVLVGASVSSRVGPDELGAVFRLLGRLIPAVPES